MEWKEWGERERRVRPVAMLLAPERLEHNKAVVRRYVELVWNRQKLSQAREMLAPTYVYHCSATQRDYPGYAGLAEVLSAYSAAIPDHRAEISEMIAEGDKVSLFLKLSGTFRGPYLGIQPTGRRISCSAAGIYRLVDGKIADDWCYDNLAHGLLRAARPHH